MKLGGFPQSRSELDGFDTIVLGDVRPATWPRGLARHIYGAVTDGGKSLVVIVGAHLGDWIDVPELTRLLPVELTRDSGTPISGQVEVRITPEGKASSWFALTEKQGDAAEDVPATLPTLEHVYPVLRKRPAATVLLEAIGAAECVRSSGSDRGAARRPRTGSLHRHRHFVALAIARPANRGGRHAAFRLLAARVPGGSLDGADVPRLVNCFCGLNGHSTASEIRSRKVSAELSAGNEASVPVLDGTIILPDGRRLPLALQSHEHLGGTSLSQFEPSQSGRYRLEVTARSDGQTRRRPPSRSRLRPAATKRTARRSIKRL